MHDYVKPYIEKIESFAQENQEHIELLVIGGLAMSFYGLPRFTIDIDAEIKCNDDIFFKLLEYLKSEGIASNIGDNVNGWGVVPLPTDYRERTDTVYKSDYLTLKTLEPLDFVFSKLLRGTEDDFNDMIDVISRYKITSDSLIERKKLVKLPKDPETLFFEEKFKHLLKLVPN